MTVVLVYRNAGRQRPGIIKTREKLFRLEQDTDIFRKFSYVVYTTDYDIEGYQNGRIILCLCSTPEQERSSIQ